MIRAALAPTDLHSLSYWGPDSTTEAGMVDCSLFAKLTKLTKLKLGRLPASQIGDLGPLQNLALQKLTLYSCEGLLEALITHGYFQSLQKVHFQKNLYKSFDGLFDLSDPPPGNSPEEEQILLDFWKTLSALPSLVEVSGRARLFLLDAPEGWLLWSKPSQWPIRFSLDAEVVWRKCDPP